MLRYCDKIKVDISKLYGEFNCKINISLLKLI